MKVLVQYLMVGVFGFAGAIARFGFGRLVGRYGLNFPYATMFINVSGSMFLGWFTTYALARNVPETWRFAIGIGFVGAYTTFSTLMYDSNDLASKGALAASSLNLIGSLILGMLAVRFGVYFGSRSLTAFELYVALSE